ncbi:MAG: hypothetical protein ACE5KT_09545 [Methanosarcinales archaeon]
MLGNTYVCTICGMEVLVTKEGFGDDLVCCGESMQLKTEEEERPWID